MALRVLILGGTAFMGRRLAERLLASGAAVTLLNRGRHPDPFGDRVSRILADRRGNAFVAAVRGHTYDAVVDFLCFDARDAELAVTACDGRVGHYLMISSGAVYMVLREVDRPVPHALWEDAYAGTPLDPPRDPEDLASYRYGMGKRAAEDVLEAAAARGFPATRLRLPVVNGEQDPSRRFETYLYRLVDGGPVLIPDGGVTWARHVHHDGVARAIAMMLGRAETIGEAFNLSQDEQPTVAELVRLAARLLGVPARTVAVPSALLRQHGLAPRVLSPWSGAWSSCLDASRAAAVWGFTHEPLALYLARIVAHWQAHPPAQPPDDYAQRPRELALADAWTPGGRHLDM
jgi:nucleoside-diphosphate-sugar epimerase